MSPSVDEILLVTPPIKNFQATPAPSLGLLFLASSLRARGLGITLLDLPTLPAPKNALADAVSSLQPLVVGFGCMHQDLETALELSRLVKLLHPGSKVVLGGPGASSRAKQIMNECAAVDFVVVGEGEHSFVSLVEALRNHHSLDAVAGLVWRNESVLRDNAPAPRIADLDSLPNPAWDLLNMPYYASRRALIPLLSTRGCAANCPFCPSPAFWGYRTHEHGSANFIRQIEQLEHVHPETRIYIADDDFAQNRTRLYDILARMRDARLAATWHCNARVDSLTPHLLGEMKASGCERITIGLESASQALRSGIGKGAFSNEQVRLILLEVNRLGLRLQVNLMFGLPGESTKDMETTVRLMQEIGPEAVSVSTLTLYPGTRLENAVDRGRRGLRRQNVNVGQSGLLTFVDEVSVEEKLADLERKVGYELPRAGSW